MAGRLHPLWQGVQAEFPLLVGVFPFGLIYGAAALRAGLGPALAQSMSSLVFAGSAQFLTAQLIHAAAPGVVIVTTIAIVNLRHMLYSASVAPYIQGLSLRWKVLLSYLLTDETYAVVIAHFAALGATEMGHWFFLGAGAALWLTWQVSTALGIFLGTTIPESWPLEFALPLTLIAMLVPMLRGRELLRGGVIGAGGAPGPTAALLCAGLPHKLGLVLAALVGIGAGMLAEGRK
jgi:predicted branched-subunit amino acid permease